MTIYNKFSTFLEAKAAQEYDFNLFCAKKFAELIPIDLETILSLKLHLDQDLRHKYYEINGIILTNEKKMSIHDLVNYLNGTNRWANIFLYEDFYVYLVCSYSDITYNTIDIVDDSIGFKTLNDDGVYIPATDWE